VLCRENRRRNHDSNRKGGLLRDNAKLVLKEEWEVGIRCLGEVALGVFRPRCLNPNYQAIEK
jgi:hypothetical protein